VEFIQAESSSVQSCFRLVRIAQFHTFCPREKIQLQQHDTLPLRWTRCSNNCNSHTHPTSISTSCAKRRIFAQSRAFLLGHGHVITHSHNNHFRSRYWYNLRSHLRRCSFDHTPALATVRQSHHVRQKTVHPHSKPEFEHTSWGIDPVREVP
jgi:hypothetical protein